MIFNNNKDFIHIYENGEEEYEKFCITDLKDDIEIIPELKVFGKKSTLEKCCSTFTSTTNYNDFDDPDLIIIGYGTTSSCIVNELRDTGLKIVVLNQGPLIEDDNVKHLRNFNTVWKNPTYTTIVGISETNNNVTQGRIMGGSSMHNGCVAIKPSKNYLKNIEMNDYELPIQVNSTNNNNKASEIIIETISNLSNIPIVENHNNHNCSISKNCQMFINENNERSMVTQLLKDLPYNINIIEGFCNNVIIENKNVIGINCTINNRNIVLNCRNVIVSAGINSSVILERSGIGSRNLLEKLDIDVNLDNPNVGNNVNNQVGPSFCIKFPKKYLNDLNNNELGVLGMGFLPDDRDERKFQVMITQYPFVNDAITKLFNLKDTISINICDLNPESSGSINIVSKDVNSQPLINLRTYNDHEDIENGVFSLDFLYDIYLNIKQKIPEVELVFPTEDMLATMDFEKLLLLDSLVTEHYTGSCRMGTSIDDSVVDNNFKVHEINGLYVCDASVFPYSVDGNPQYACMLLGINFSKKLKNNF